MITTPQARFFTYMPQAMEKYAALGLAITPLHAPIEGPEQIELFTHQEQAA
jgi:hypothetical protein